MYLDFKQTHPNAFHPWRSQIVKEGDKTGPIIGYIFILVHRIFFCG